MRDAADDLLRQYREASADAEVERLLAVILEEVARPIVRRIVASTVARDAGGASDAEDVVADTLADLLRRLRELRADAATPIHDLRGYIVTSAYNRCRERLRERHPARNRLRNQVQYLCGHHPRLAVWRSAQGAIVCGLRGWEGREAAADAGGRRVRIAAHSDPTAENRAQLVTLVPALLREAGAPLELDLLVSAIADLIQLEPQRAEVPLTSLELTAEVAADDALAVRMSLRELWRDVRQLAPKQRAALLLNLRDPNGRDCLSLLPLTRTATIAEIAAALEMPLETLAALWNELPLSDARIGELLEMTSRQVIKLRRLARERLRRMQKSRTDRNLGAELDSSLKKIAL